MDELFSIVEEMEKMYSNWVKSGRKILKRELLKQEKTKEQENQESNELKENTK